MANRFRIHKLSNVDQFVMSYGGLRGAVAFALVLLIDQKHVPLQPLFVTTTICVIYFTVFLQGITIKPLVRILNVKRAEKRKPTMNEVIFGVNEIRDSFRREQQVFLSDLKCIKNSQMQKCLQNCTESTLITAWQPHSLHSFPSEFTSVSSIT